MKKQKLTYRIIRTMSEEQVKDIGLARFSKTHTKECWAGTIVSSVSLIAGVILLQGSVMFVSVIPAFLFIAWWLSSSLNEGKKVLNFIKGKDQPVDLDELDG